MKLHRFFGEIILFFSILVAFLLPPIFSQNQNFNSQFEWNFPLNQLLLGVFAFFVFIFEQKNSNNYSFTNNSKKFFTKKNIIFTAITFLSLCFIVFFLETIAFFLKSNNPQISVAPLDKKIKIFFCLLNFIFSAFFEEVIYRLYLPQQLKRFFFKYSERKDKKIYSRTYNNNFICFSTQVFRNLCNDKCFFCLYSFTHLLYKNSKYNHKYNRPFFI